MLVNRVKDYRKGANITQNELASMVGVSRQSIISIEKNKFIPGLDVALKRTTLKIRHLHEKR